MQQKRNPKRPTPVSAEERNASRAFRRAMSAGLKSTYDGIAQKAVPDEFMHLLERADRKAKA